MTESLVLPRDARGSQHQRGAVRWMPVLPRMAWRNLGRRRYRTWMSVGSFAFAVVLVGAGICLQVGSYDSMIKRGTELMSGHAQLQHPGWLDEARIEHFIDNPEALARVARRTADVVGVSVRVQASALLANGAAPDNAGKAGLIMGIDPETEGEVSNLPGRIIEGRYLSSGLESSGHDAIVGEALARNLNLSVGDELVVIGVGESGGTAAFVCEVVGIFDAGFPLLNRTLVQVPLTLARAAFELEGKAHGVVMRFEDPLRSTQVLARLEQAIEREGRLQGLAVRDWREVNSELYDGIRMDAISSVFIYSIIILMVGFTILGSVLMVMFERRAEFGVLMALGLNVGALRRLMCWEVFWLWGLGMAAGLFLVGAVVGWYGEVGIPLPTDEGMQELLESAHLDPRLYPMFSSLAFVWIPLLLLLLAELAVLVATRRLGLQPPALILRSA